MTDVVAVWKDALPPVRNGVTGVGIWAALNGAVPIAYEDGVFVLGLSSKDNELSGHLKLVLTKKLIEQELTKRLGQPVTSRIIEGTTDADWERTKRKDAEAKRLQEIAASKFRAELTAKTNWEGVYEQLGRKYAAVQNRTLPQNRARF